MAQPITHSDSKAGVNAFVKALSAYYRQLPGTSEPGLRPPGVTIRSKLPNTSTTQVPRPGNRPPAEHYAKILAAHVARTPAPKEELFKPRAEKIIHPGKQLTLRAVKAIHLSNPKVYKVKA